MNARPYKPHLVPDIMVAALNRYDDEPCLYIHEELHSYRDVREKTSQYIQALSARGVGKGARVAILSGNRPEVLYFNAANYVAGCCVSPLHPLGSLDDHAYVMEDAEIEALIYDSSVFEKHVGLMKERLPNVKHWLSLGASSHGEDISALAESFTPEPLVATKVDPEDICYLVYTGGTTGKPKGVMLSQRSITYMTMIQMVEWEIPEGVRWLVCTPMSHAGGTALLPTLLKGGTFYVPQAFNAETFFDMVEEHRINATLLVPILIYLLLDSERADKADLSSLTKIFYGASSINPARLKDGVKRWGQIFHQFYGQTEAPTCFVNMKSSEHDLSKSRRFAACGRPSPWIEVELMNDTGEILPIGEVGEICVRGPLIMSGYKGLPEQTAETIVDGWVHTGDVGQFDEEGFLYIVDRKKDMIITGGFNVFPREVEDVIAEHENVAQVAVIGVPDEHWGEAVKAIIVKKGHVASEDALSRELVAMVKTAKGSVQAPKSVVYIDAIPLTPVGKPDKKALKGIYHP